MAKFKKDVVLSSGENVEIHKICGVFQIWVNGRKITDVYEEDKYFSAFIAHCINLKDSWSPEYSYYKCSEDIQKLVLESLDSQIVELQEDLEKTVLCKDLILSTIIKDPNKFYGDNVTLVTFSYANNPSYNAETDVELAGFYNNSNLEFTVPYKWLEKFLDFDITHTWLNEYTHDDAFLIYSVAKNEKVIISEGVKVHESYIESLKNK